MNAQNANADSSELKEFFTNHLKNLYWAEKKLVDVLPDLEDAATSQDLKNAFSEHLEQTKQHVTRLEKVFSIIGEEPDANKCKILDSIADAGSSTIKHTDDGTALRDAGLIFSGQMAEHYEIAFYGNLIPLAKALGYSEAASILSTTLEEEKEADALLSKIGEHSVNNQVSNEVWQA